MEDFASKDQPLVGKIAFVLNPGLEILTQALNKNITFQDNVYCQVKDVTVTVDANGIPTSTTQIKSTLNNNSQGLMCVLAINSTNPSVYPTGYPFISFTETNKLITIQHITGLQPNNSYQLRIISIG